jgi:ribosomal protein L20
VEFTAGEAEKAAQPRKRVLSDQEQALSPAKESVDTRSNMRSSAAAARSATSGRLWVIRINAAARETASLTVSSSQA